ncbi:MAG: DEAD/DEAH box helicase family protein [Thermodesulfobacteriota bacterium]|nr:DEAD/DEAH box helicase family protein [Thermodesulfobacteriota bacterium]
MGTPISLKEFLDEYGESMAKKVTNELAVVHDPTTEKEEDVSCLLSRMKKRPFPSQAEIIKACYKSLVSGNRAVYTVCEMGTGKTLMAIATSYVLSELKNIRRVLVVCPPHLVPKWIQEIKEGLWDAEAYNLNGRDVITQLQNLKEQPRPDRLEFYVIGRERAKTGFLWEPAVVTRRGRHFCPKCGKELLDRDGCPLPVFEKNTQGRFKKRHRCRNTICKWKYNADTGRHEKVVTFCGEQLWEPDNTRRNYRKVIPARFIKLKMKGFFDVLVADEVHQLKNESGQGYAFGALASACKHVLCLTGTLVGGYASDVYYLLFRTHPQLMRQENHTWGNPRAFIEQYGVLERITTLKTEDGLTTKAKRRTIVKEKPGISPLLLGKMLLPNAVFMRLSDCMEHLQPYEEDVIELAMPPQMAHLYAEFEEVMKQTLKAALAVGDNSLLGAYVHALLSYPERIYKGLEVIHPHTKETVAIGPPLQGVMPKEHELLSIVKRELKQHHRVLVYIENSNTTDISPRLTAMMEQEGIKVKFLRSGDTEGRAKIINRWTAKGMKVLITNPRKVEVGMDLLEFPSIVFYQLPMSTYTLRQASRRSWRIPQKKPVKVTFLTYSATMQTRLMQLMADKLMCSLAIEGELSDRGLAALSDTSDSMAKELARMLLNKAQDRRSLKDIWAQFRKREVRVEMRLQKDISEPEPQPETLEKREMDEPSPEIRTASTELERVGDRVVKVEFVEYIGKRKKKVTHIEVRQAELDQMLKSSDKLVAAQFTLF